MFQKKSRPTPDPVQTDPMLYGTGHWSSGFEMGVLPMSQGTWGTHRFVPKTNQTNVAL